jgi:cyanate permease
LLLSLATASLIRRIGTVATARTGLVTAALGLLAGALGHFGGLVVASVLLSAGVALAIPGLIGTLASRAVPASRARAMSIYSFALFAGASLAPLAAHALAPWGWLALMLPPAAALLFATAVVDGLPQLSRPSSSEAGLL